MELIIKELSKSYQGQCVLDSINLAFRGGDVVGLVGKNGAGKTTFLNCLIDLVKPDAGDLIFNGERLTGDRLALKRTLGVLSDVLPPVPEFSGFDYLRFVGILHGVEETTFQKRSQELTAFFFDDTGALTKKISTYSTGMIKKIGLCGALLTVPSILLLDEPFAGLDPLSVNQLISFLKNYQRADRLVIIASHDLNYIQEVATRLVVLDEAVIKFDGGLSEFTANGTKLINDALFDILAPKTKTMAFDWL
ncbi:ABC transporter ATP-binding protein [Larkinella bovis]|uniref:ABC transporter ATP-binding protein n=1 Tax=Larkinella bovis TaxID=683041 RepID=A0ABW0IG83_9BACT